MVVTRHSGLSYTNLRATSGSSSDDNVSSDLSSDDDSELLIVPNNACFLHFLACVIAIQLLHQNPEICIRQCSILTCRQPSLQHTRGEHHKHP